VHWSIQTGINRSRVNLDSPFANVYVGDNGDAQRRERACDQENKYAPGYREAEEQRYGLPVGYDLQRILVDGGSLLKIIEE
jgi:hypothetical protein